MKVTKDSQREVLENIKDNLIELAKHALFEVNDQLLRNNFKVAITNYLSPLVVTRKLNDFTVVCDESNNNLEDSKRGILKADVAVQLTEGAAFIYIPIQISPGGA